MVIRQQCAHVKVLDVVQGQGLGLGQRCAGKLGEIQQISRIGDPLNGLDRLGGDADVVVKWVEGYGNV